MRRCVGTPRYAAFRSRTEISSKFNIILPLINYDINDFDNDDINDFDGNDDIDNDIIIDRMQNNCRIVLE
jgi:hypothetical protein